MRNVGSDVCEERRLAGLRLGDEPSDLRERRQDALPERIVGARLFEPALVDEVFAFACAALPLLTFGRNAIDRARERGS